MQLNRVLLLEQHPRGARAKLSHTPAPNNRRCLSRIRISCEATASGSSQSYQPNAPPQTPPLPACSNKSDIKKVQQPQPAESPPSSTSSRTTDQQSLQGGGLATGFPVPTGYANSSITSNDGYDFFGRTKRPFVKPPPLSTTLDINNNTSTYNTKTTSTNGGGSELHEVEDASTSDGTGPMIPVLPVYRSAPYRAEIKRQRTNVPTARILFVDEGNTFRSILAASFLRLMLSKLHTPVDVTVETASIGPATMGQQHDPRVLAIAREMGLALEPRHLRQFDEVADAVNYDLVIVMDSFDHQEILKEVAVLDAINPGGYYSLKIKRLGPFGAAARNAPVDKIKQDIADSLYGLAESPEEERKAVRDTAKELAFACRGLVDYLLMLQKRCGTTGMTVRLALAQSLQCPVLGGNLVPTAERLASIADFRPVWTENVPRNGEKAGEYYTVRVVNGQRRVVKKRDKPRGFWRDESNVADELRLWMSRHGVVDRLPTQKELRKSGASSLAAAVDALGGLSNFAERWGLEMASRRPNGYWEDFDNLKQALQPFLIPTTSGGGGNNSTSSSTDSDVVYVMPTQRQLVEAGRSDLLRAIRQHGGMVAVGKKVGARANRQPALSEADVMKQLLDYIHNRYNNSSTSGSIQEGAVEGGVMPSKSELEGAGLSGLVADISRLGGFRRFAAKAGLEYKPSGNNNSSSGGSRLEQCIIEQASSSTTGTITNGVGTAVYSNKATTSTSTTNASATATINNNTKEDLRRRSASAPFPSYTYTSLPLHDHETLIDIAGREVLQWLEDYCQPQMHQHRQDHCQQRYMPTHQELLDSDRADLWLLIQRSGGAKRLAEKLGLQFVETRGRRAKVDNGNGGGGGSGGKKEKKKVAVEVMSAKEEIEIFDAYEEFKIV